MFYKQTEIRFGCTGCGRCCLGHADENVIELISGEAKKISQYLSMDLNDFMKKYSVKLENHDDGIAFSPQGCCVFLQENNRCAIYAVRPRQCQTYPYWPEIMSSESAWNAEAGRCEGINAGEIISTERIDKQLAVFDASK